MRYIIRELRRSIYRTANRRLALAPDNIDPVLWLGSRVVSVLDSGAVGPGFKSQPRRCPVTILGKTVRTHSASVHQAAKLVATLLKVAGVTVGLALMMPSVLLSSVL